VILRFINIVIIGALVLAASYVYRIKYESTMQAERLAKLRSELRHERDLIATLRAKWGELDSPARVEALSKRFLQLKPIAPTQFDPLDRLPERPADDARAANDDPIGNMIGNLEPPEGITGSILAPPSDAAPPPLESTPPPPPDSPSSAAPEMTPDAAPGEDEALSPADEDANR
jgi:hypothetical protein